MMKESFAKRMKEGMDIKNIKQVDLVEKTGIGKSAINHYVSGKYEPNRKIPVLGTIAAGEPVFADENFESYVEAGADFCLKVQGGSRKVQDKVQDESLDFT